MSKPNLYYKKERVIVYVDGFNLYFGLKEAGFLSSKWLDIKRLCIDLLKPNQTLAEVKYFTSRVSNNPDKQKRQTTYLEALQTTGVKVYYGHYQTTKAECRTCGATWSTFNEKMTDVNIATQMIMDAYSDRCDMAMLISGDSDLVPPIIAIHGNFPGKRVFVAFPPKRHNSSVANVSKGSLVIGRKKLINNQLPSEVMKSDGVILRKPSEWI
jgi:uncharacterized LabA/DUF88 family protein